MASLRRRPAGPTRPRSRSCSSGFRPTARQAEALALLRGDAEHILLYGGSRSGKTFLLTACVVSRALAAPGSRHAIWRFRANQAMASIWSDTLPKVLRCCWPGLRPRWRRGEGVLRFANGSEIWLGGLDDPDRVDKVLGQEFSTVYFNECSQIPHGSVTTALTRLAQSVALLPDVTAHLGETELRPKAYYDCNPPSRKHWVYRRFVLNLDPESGRAGAPGLFAHLRMNPDDNRENLPPGYIERTLAGLPARKRLRFLEGEFADDREGALWNYGVIRRVARAPELRRVVVAVDPATSARSGSDETGIVAAGVGFDRNGYVLADASLKGSPDLWGRAAVDLARRLGADRIVAEANQGGDMVAHVIRTVDVNVPFRAVFAARGKAIRAEPVAALYEQGRVFHVGDFEALEEQMCDFTLDFDRKAAGYSPDRLDALVWALTELMLDNNGTGLLDLYAEEAVGRTVRSGLDDVTLRAPTGFCTTLYLADGRRLTVGHDGLVRVGPEDVRTLRAQGFVEVL